ncbi:ATP-binding SpoIIE family protein phosphatase [Streptomyces spiralis]
MLEQVGQALEQIRSREAGYVLIQTMQRMLLPRNLPHLTEATIAARYLPATAEAEVGGDWYDVVTPPAGGIGLVIGDVEGHTLEAAAVMGQLRTAVRAYAAEGHEPAIVLERANQILTRLDTDLYATCCCMWLDLATGISSVATAGHPVPLISSPQGDIITARLSVGPPLGINAASRYQQSETRLPPGSVTALITDGLLDVRRLGLDLALRQLTDLLTVHCADNPDALADLLLQRRPSAASGHDDAALLLLRYEGPHSADHPRIAQTSVGRHHLQGVAHVRQFLRDQLHQWNLDTVLDEMEVLVSEVVTNALIHAHSEVDLRLRALPDRIRVDVRDSDPHPPVPTSIISTSEANQEAESGRGLLIVDALATAWGSSPVGRGKNTWFEYRIG